MTPFESHASALETEQKRTSVASRAAYSFRSEQSAKFDPISQL